MDRLTSGHAPLEGHSGQPDDREGTLHRAAGTGLAGARRWALRRVRMRSRVPPVGSAGCGSLRLEGSPTAPPRGLRAR